MSEDSSPIISGVKLADDRKLDFEKDILPGLIHLGERAQEKGFKKQTQKITVRKSPFMIVLVSDVHGK